MRNDTGDGFVVEFDDEASAVACMGELVKNSGSSELAVRVGLAVGPVVREGEKLAGGLLDFATRICEQARPNRVVADDRIKLRAPLHPWERMEKVTLRGVGSRLLWRLPESD